jgi:hypothetical protein
MEEVGPFHSIDTLGLVPDYCYTGNRNWVN